MSYSVAQMYPGAYTPDGAFIDGKYSNSSAPGVYDGTPLDNLLFNQNLAFFDAMMTGASLDYGDFEDTPATSQLYQAMLRNRVTEPLNGFYNGYFRTSQSSIPSPDGFPTTSGLGGTTYGAGESFTAGWSVVNAGTNVSVDNDGMIFNNSVRLQIQLGTETTLADSDITLYCRDNLNNQYWFVNGDTGVTIGVSSGLVTVTLTTALLGALTGTKLKWCFALDQAGVVREISNGNVWDAVAANYNKFSTDGYARLPGGMIMQWGQELSPAAGTDTSVSISFPINFQNNVLSLTLQLEGDHGTQLEGLSVRSKSQSGFVMSKTGDNAPQNVMYIAIGY